MKRLQGKELIKLCEVYGKATSKVLVREQSILIHNVMVGKGSKSKQKMAFDLVGHELQARKIKGIF